MKKVFQLITIVSSAALLCFTSCKKESFITSADALLRTSEDTLHFDTVFTKLGSTTQFLKIFNANDKKLKLSSLELMGGAASFFKLNVDGIAGTSFKDIELEANDSVYLFASVFINPNVANLPFLVRDSIKIEFNGNTKWIQLEAYGKNGRYMKDVIVTTDSTIKNDLPTIILGSLTVNENIKLTIEKGTQIFIHPNAPININGTLIAKADTGNKITFQGIRIDEPYKNYPGSWPGLYFGSNSKSNILEYCVLKNAYQGIVAQSPASNGAAKVTLNQCVLDNIYDRAMLFSNSSCTATNCLISNVGFGVYAISGGNYSFNHCTFASYSNSYLSHKESLITLSNTNSDKTISNNLSAAFNNSIIYGEGGFVDDEIIVPVKDDNKTCVVAINNVLYKSKTNLSSSIFNINTASIRDQNPLFDSIDVSNRKYNFRLRANSPCINKAATSTVNIDLEGNPRPVGTADLGCYEKQ